jgi:hypothetical protein
MVKLLKCILAASLVLALLTCSGCRFLLEDDTIDDSELNLPSSGN